ncbi:hypothetical protein HELRODRAFT_111430 [Helobdella robusta]|uniref:cystathionine gamma-lyase n=1 Tax=Helobdella robusta TaxID=6412 RepID=T1EFB3_HELRO|nr:hypothetical protein HELRODRAFT_111430 [Helobdella robusta]ESO04975.1 hypothetical protein HELRODRAFT_111430 [Helobdella robusta]
MSCQTETKDDKSCASRNCNNHRSHTDHTATDHTTAPATKETQTADTYTKIINNKDHHGLDLVKKCSCADDDPFGTFPHFATTVIHAGQNPKQWNCRAVVPLISLSTTFQAEEPGAEGKFEYVRAGNPTRKVAETCVAAIENGKHCFLYASGLAATVNIFHLLKGGDHVICMDDVYGGTNRYINKVLVTMDIEATFVDATEPANVKQALKPNTKMLWLETPTNPTLKVVDIEAASAVAHQQPGVIVVVDNTFMSSYFQRPLDLGADVSFQSLTKYMNGHSDVLMGSLTTNNDELAEKLKFLQNALGAVPSPFDCYMLNRGLKTLALRMRQHMKNGLQVARYLQDNPRVEKVIHPGLPSHPQHAIAKKQCKGYSGMITFSIKGGREEACLFLKSLKVFSLAESLGGYESLAEHPALMTHASVSVEDRMKLGITDSMIRLSVGLEDVEDLIEDLDEALMKAVPIVRN